MINMREIGKETDLPLRFYRTVKKDGITFDLKTIEKYIDIMSIDIDIFLCYDIIAHIKFNFNKLNLLEDIIDNIKRGEPR